MRNSVVANICATFELRKFAGNYFFEVRRLDRNHLKPFKLKVIYVSKLFLIQNAKHRLYLLTLSSNSTLFYEKNQSLLHFSVLKEAQTDV